MKRTLCAVLSALFLSVSAIPCAATDSATPLLPAERRDTAFADIPAGAWYADAVKLCYEAGVLNGTSETTFSPQETLTAAQLEVLMARVKWRLEGNTEDLPAAPAGSGAVSITLSDGSTYDAASFVQVAPTGLGRLGTAPGRLYRHIGGRSSSGEDPHHTDSDRGRNIFCPGQPGPVQQL